MTSEVSRLYLQTRRRVSFVSLIGEIVGRHQSNKEGRKKNKKRKGGQDQNEKKSHLTDSKSSIFGENKTNLSPG